MMQSLFFTLMISRTVGILIMAGMFAFCQSDNTSKKADAAESKQAKKAPESKAINDSQKESKLVVYYFHTNFRCHSCHYIEETTRKAIEETFVNEIKSGRMEFRMINVEEAGNEHFEKDYKLYTKSVILSDTKDGKETGWTNLEKVWQLIGNDQGFKEYIVREVNAYLGA